MSKHEAPPFRMIVQGGRLVPAAAWDAERLATYRNGSAVSVRITQEKNRKLERKYWAILNRVVETCGVKQRSAEELHRAIRYELDMVEGFSTIDGQLRIEVKSTAGMEEPEYRQFFEDAMGLLRDKLNIDPETIGAEAADVGEDDEEPSSDVSTDDEGGADTADGGAGDAGAPTDTAEADGAGDGAADGQTAAPAPSGLSEEDRAWLVTAAKMLIASAEPNGDPNVVRNQYAGLIKTQTPAGISQLAIAKAVSISKHLVAVCEATVELDLDLLAGIAGCDRKELA